MLPLRMMVPVLTTGALLAAAPAAMATRYAAPGGTNGDPCTFAQPCSITTAITGATALDKEVRLFGGHYPALPATVQTAVGASDIGAEPGTGRPVIHLGGGTQLRVIGGSRIADVDIVADLPVGDALFMADGGVIAERIRVSGPAASGVRLGASGTPSTLRDSLVLNSSPNSSSTGVSMECNGCTSTARVSNVTVITKSGPALKAIADPNGASSATMHVVNTIALATGGGVPDVEASAPAMMGNDKAIVNLTNSAYGDVLASAPREEVNDLGGHVTAAPLFVSAAAGDYRQAPGSPTIDAGVPSLFEGPMPTDLFGSPRTLGIAPDIGADETPAAPVVTTGAATGVGTTAASIAGDVTPNGASTAWRVEYGTTTAYGTTASGAPATGAGFVGEAVALPLSGLAPGTSYHYRVAAGHAYGSGFGQDATFTTAGEPAPGGGGTVGGGSTPAPAPGVTPLPAPVVTPKPRPLPPLAKGCVSLRDFTIRLKQGVKANAVTVTVDGKRAKVVRGKRISARVDLRGKAKKIVVVKVVVAPAKGQRTTTERRYRTCAKKAAGRNEVRL